MKEKIEVIIKKVCKKWDFYKSKEVIDRFGGDYSSSEGKTATGDNFCWNSPKILWLLINIDGDGYEEHGTQIGLTKEGKIVWQFQSHCSCNGFGDMDTTDGELCVGCEKEAKSFELNYVPDDWEQQVFDVLTKISKIK